VPEWALGSSRGTLIVPNCTQIVLADFAKLLKEMVGTWGLEPQTSTVSGSDEP
jgi:hypothetical protein